MPAHISIHALREESDAYGAEIAKSNTISIHALREESDQQNPALRENSYLISIHALREESDKPAYGLKGCQR